MSGFAALVLLVLLATAPAAARGEPAASTEPVVCRVGVNLEDLYDFDPARETFGEWNSLTVRVRGGEKVEVTVRAEGKSADAGASLEKKARQVVKNVRDGLPKVVAQEGPRKALDGLFKALAVSRKDETVTLKATLTDEEARKLVPAPRDRTRK